MSGLKINPAFQRVVGDQSKYSNKDSNISNEPFNTSLEQETSLAKRDNTILSSKDTSSTNILKVESNINDSETDITKSQIRKKNSTSDNSIKILKRSSFKKADGPQYIKPVIGNHHISIDSNPNHHIRHHYGDNNYSTIKEIKES